MISTSRPPWTEFLTLDLRELPCTPSLILTVLYMQLMASRRHHSVGGVLWTTETVAGVSKAGSVMVTVLMASVFTTTSLALRPTSAAYLVAGREMGWRPTAWPTKCRQRRRTVAYNFWSIRERQWVWFCSVATIGISIWWPNLTATPCRPLRLRQQAPQLPILFCCGPGQGIPLDPYCRRRHPQNGDHYSLRAVQVNLYAVRFTQRDHRY
jgi:hypothetical protein